MSSHLGWVEEARGGIYRVVLEDDTRVDATVRGRLKLSDKETDRIVVGDRVQVERDGDAWVIVARTERATALVRAGFRARVAKVIAANVDQLALMVAAADPAPHEEWIDRMLVIGEHAGLDPILLVNKIDLAGGRAEEIAFLYRAVGVPVHLLSVVTGEGTDAVADALADSLTALVGPSGVGKSSLLNRLVPELAMRTGTVSVDGRGRHTTVSSRVVTLAKGGRVVDTPGFADAQPWDVLANELDRCFVEMGALRDQCRFRECSHRHEPGCAIRAAVESDAIAPSRYHSYLKLREALEERATRDYR